MRHRMHIGTIVSDSMLEGEVSFRRIYRCYRRIFYFTGLTSGGCVYAGRPEPGICDDQGHDGAGTEIQFDQIDCAQLERKACHFLLILGLCCARK